MCQVFLPLFKSLRVRSLNKHQHMSARAKHASAEPSPIIHSPAFAKATSGRPVRPIICFRGPQKKANSEKRKRLE